MKHRFKKLLAIVLATSLCIPTLPTETARAETDSPSDGIFLTDPETISANDSFNEGWKFYLGDSNTAHEVNFNDYTWQNIQLPHDFSITQDFTSEGEAESGFLPGGTGWYRKNFALPESYEGKSIVLNFDGVYKDATVYINGEKLGEHHYGYTNFAFDLSDKLICDNTTENVLAVKVVNNLPSSRWYSGSGIYRDVELIITDPVHVPKNGTYVTTPNLATSAGSNGAVNIDVDVQNDSDASASVTIKNTIYEKGSDTSVATISKDETIPSGETKKVTTETSVESPKLWSTKTPNLYIVRTEILQGTNVLDSYDTEFGFKWFEFKNNEGFILNGEHVKINGVCMHHDQGALGASAYYDAIYRQMTIMKDMGVNTIRVTHNPAAEILVDICNELGLLVIEEAFDGWGIPKNGNSNDFSVYFDRNLTSDNHVIDGDPSMTWAEFALKSMVKRDRNDASIILWSFGNEIQEGTGGNYDWASAVTKMLRWVKEVDTAHLPTSGSNNRSIGTTGVPAVNDSIFKDGGVVGYNYGDINFMNQAKNTYPVMLWSETASAVNSRGIYTSQASQANADGKYHLTSYDTSSVGWGKTAHASMYPTLSNDFIAGECVWTGFDYIGEPTPWNGTGTGDGGRGAIPNSSYFGIVDTAGFPKDNYYLYRSQWNHDANTLHLVTAWDPDNQMKTNGKTPVWVYSNAAKVELYLDDELIGTATRKDVSSTTTAMGHVRYEYTTTSNKTAVCETTSGTGDQSLYSVFNVTYAAGTISAKAFDENGADITSQCAGKTSVTTPTKSGGKLVASTDKTSIDADGKSLSYITIDVTDADGNPKTTATNDIRFTLTGEGEILGVDNGDQATVDKYQQASVLTSGSSAHIKAYAGKALVIVRSTKTAGSFEIKAEAEGLTPATASVSTKAVVSDSEPNQIKNYTLSKHCYVPVNSEDIKNNLPQNITASYTKTTGTKTLNITWADYDLEKLNEKGTFKIYGYAVDSELNQTISLSVTVHVYKSIINVQKHSLYTEPNTVPTLPAVSMTYDTDGDEFEEFPIEWDTSNITNDSFDTNEEIITISGKVNALGVDYPTQAAVRVATPVETRINVAPDRDHLADNGPYNDSLPAITDKNRSDTGGSAGRWSTWDKKDSTERNTNIQITMDWATATTTDEIDLFFFKQTDRTDSVLPDVVKFEYALSSNYENGNITANEWIEIEYDDPTNIDVNSYNETLTTVGKAYHLKEMINPQAIRITFEHPAKTFIGLNEVEVQKPTYAYNPKTSAALPGVTIGEQTVTFNNTTESYNVTIEADDSDEIPEITFENPENTAVTILPLSDSLIKILSVSEDKQSAKTYTLNITRVHEPDCTCEITGITVHPANPQININADGTNNTVTLQPSATISECEVEGHPDSGSVEYTYAVENAGTTKATVDSKTGVVTATEEGEAVISVTASLNGKTKTQTVTVNVTKLNANCTCEITGLTITPEEPKITMDVDDESGSVDLKATASRNDACPVEGHLTNEPVITYEVLNAGTTEASVDNKGKVTAKKAGIATIRVTASLNGKSRYEDISVTVSKSDPDCSCKIDGLTIDPAETKIAIPANEEEGSVTLNPVLSRNDDCSVEGHPNSNKVTYSYRVADPGSTNATVNSKTGAVTATAAGFAKIEVTALLESGEPYVTIVTITVTKHDPNCTCEIDDITFDPAEPKISIEKDATEGSVQLKPTASLKNDDCSVEGHPDSNHITYTFKVEESGDTGAEVDENGNVTATAEGTATIKVTALLSSGEPYSKTIQVKVTKDTTSGEDTKKGPWTITLNGNGATLTKKSIANIKDGAAAAKPANPTRAHYTFLGWSKSVNGAIYNWQTPVTGNFTLYAKWQLKKYYVTFDANGGTGAPARIQVNALSKVNPPKTTPTKKGYKFVCWTSSKNGAAYNWSSPVTKDLTLYAKWTEDAPKFDETSQTTDPKTKITYKVSNADKKTAVVMSSGNKNLKKVEIKEKVEINGVTCTIVEIGKNAFKGCSRLTEVKIGKGVKKINKNAFNGCKKLKKITFQGTKAPSVKSGAFKKTSSKMTVKVPKKMKSSQKKKLLNALKKAGINKKTKIK